MHWPGARMPRDCSDFPELACAIRCASPAVRPRCGGTSASPIAMRCSAHWTNTRTNSTGSGRQLRAATARRSGACSSAHAPRGAGGSRGRNSGAPGRFGPHRPENDLDHLDLAPIRRVRGTVKLPGSKSISNRILLLAALAEGDTRIHDLLDSDDT